MGGDPYIYGYHKYRLNPLRTPIRTPFTITFTTTFTTAFYEHRQRLRRARSFDAWPSRATNVFAKIFVKVLVKGGRSDLGRYLFIYSHKYRIYKYIKYTKYTNYTTYTTYELWKLDM